MRRASSLGRILAVGSRPPPSKPKDRTAEPLGTGTSSWASCAAPPGFLSVTRSVVVPTPSLMSRSTALAATSTCWALRRGSELREARQPALERLGYGEGAAARKPPKASRRAAPHGSAAAGAAGSGRPGGRGCILAEECPVGSAEYPACEFERVGREEVR